MGRTSAQERRVMSALDSWLRNVQASGAAERTVTAYAAVTNSF